MTQYLSAAERNSIQNANILEYYKTIEGVDNPPSFDEWVAAKEAERNSRRLVTKSLADVHVTRQRWLVQDQMPQGVITILAGVAGIAKSTILAWYVARLTNGEAEGDYLGEKVPVVMVASEDDLGAQLVPRMQAAGADLNIITAIEGVKVTEDGESWITSPNLSDDLIAIREAVVSTGSKLLIIDPIISLMKGDSHRLEDVRKNLDPLHQMANDLGISIVLVAHFTKGAGRAADKVSGSHAFRDIARSLLVLAVDEETDERILTVEKSNYSQTKPSLAFEVESVTVPTSAGELASVGRARLLGDATITVQDLLDRDTTVLGDRSAELIKYVGEHPDGVKADDVADVLEIEVGQARTYLTRAVNAGRIIRAGRGLYQPKRNTNRTPPQSVSSVSSVSFKPKKRENDTDDTLRTVGVGVSLGVSFAEDPGYHQPCGRTLNPRGECPKCGEVDPAEVAR